ncbi:MAG: SGNH/GDSL hydrolase family protein [Bacteroidota bacterium]
MIRCVLFLLIWQVSFFLNDIKAQDWANLNKYQKSNTELLQSDTNAIDAVFMGNSITEGWYALHPDFFNNHKFVGRGISGQTTPQMLLRFRQDVIALKPKRVVILAGTNDIAGNTGPMTLEQIRDNIWSMAQLAKTNGIEPIICSVLPAQTYPWRPEKQPDKDIPALNELLKTLCKDHNYTYLDYFSAMDNGENGLSKDLAEDGVHPTEKGYLIMEAQVLKALKPLLSREEK